MATPLTGWTIAIDLDGTLVDTAPDLLAALNHVLSAENLAEVPLSDIRAMVGHGAKAMIREGFRWNAAELDESELNQKLWPKFLDYYTAHICDHSVPFPGTLGALDELAGLGASLAVCTNKTQMLAERVLDALDISDRFVAIVGADRASQKKPNAAHLLETITAAGGRRSRALLIGDSDTDERAAQHAELPFIFVTFGYGDLTANPDPQVYRVQNWEDIPDTIKTIAA